MEHESGRRARKVLGLTSLTFCEDTKLRIHRLHGKSVDVVSNKGLAHSHSGGSF